MLQPFADRLRSSRSGAALVLAALVMLVASCASSSGTASVSSPTPPAPISSDSAARLGGLFDGYRGSLTLYNVQDGTYLRVHAAQARKGYEPASTFKILNSLIALQTGVLADDREVIKWNGHVYSNPTWNRDQTLQSAIRNSVVWAYQELARRIGRERMQKYVDLVGYGNQDISGPIDYFWLDGGLRISADEQVQFLKRLYADELPFRPEVMATVRRILVRDQTASYRLSGKTGSGRIGADWVGWFVGHVQAERGTYIFAVNLVGRKASGAAAEAVAREALRRLQIIE